MKTSSEALVLPENTVSITACEEDGAWWAECSTLPNFTAFGDSLSEVLRLVDGYFEFEKCRNSND